MDVLELVLEQARAHPDRPAAKDLTTDLSFAELAGAVARLAAGLFEHGVRGGDRVGLHLANSVDFLVSTLSCMWVGAIFVPLAHADPVSRIEEIITDSEPAVVLALPGSRGTTATEIPYAGRPVASPHALSRPGAAPPPAASEESRPAYCIYTSGTTGSPKGVLIDHKAFLAAVLSAAEILGLDDRTRALCVSPFHFDGSYGTLFPVPVTGGSLVIPRRESLMLPRLFFKVVADEVVNHTSLSPTYLRLLLSSPHLSDLNRTSLRTMAVGGEALLPADLLALWDAVPNLRVFNRYGPTETTIAVTTHEVTAEMVMDGGLVPIGRPHPGVRFHILDAEGHVVVGPREVGELYIGGSQLMTGYWGDPNLTAEVMRTDAVPGEALLQDS